MLRDLKTALTQDSGTLAEDAAGVAALFAILFAVLALPAIA